MNKVILIGRTTANIELRYAGEKPVTNFTLAVDRRKEGTDFINCTAWDKVASLIAEYVKKGDRIGISGRIQTRSYDDRDGRKQYITEVVVEEVEFLTPKPKDEPKGEPVMFQTPEGDFVPF